MIQKRLKMDCAGVKRFCLACSILEMLICIVTVFGPAVEQTKHAYACAGVPSNISGDCILFDISCLTDQHILIREVLYGFGESAPNCKANVTHCRDETSPGCCTKSGSDKMQLYEIDRKYEIFKACSWKQICKRQTYIGYMLNTGLTSRFSVVEYECQKENPVVYFCTQDRTNGATVNLIFNGSMSLINEYAVECTCIVETDTNSTYSISGPDLRLQSGSADKISETVISGLVDTVINSSVKLTSINSSRHSEATSLKLSFKLNPEFIWIEAKGDDDATVYVHCFGSNNLTANYSTTVSTSTTSYSSNSPRTSEFSALDSPEVTVTAVVFPVVLLLIGAAIALVLWRRRCGRKGKSEDSGDVINFKPNTETPSKTNSHDSDTTIAVKNMAKTADNYIILEPENTYAYIDHDHGDIDKTGSNKRQISTTTENLYHFIDQPNTKTRDTCEKEVDTTANNYADVDNDRVQNKEKKNSTISNTYTYIDYKDVLNNALTIPKICNVTGKPTQTGHSVDHSYFSLNQQTKSSENGSGTDLGRTEVTKVNNLTTSDDHNYSVLEPQEVTSCNTKINLPNVEHPETHDYFVLEQQSMTNENSEQDKANIDMHDIDDKEATESHSVLGQQCNQTDVGLVDAGVTDVHQKEATECHNYFVLEPQNTISSFEKTKADITDTHKEDITGETHNYFILEERSLGEDTNDPVLQTLPVTEYNVLHLKSKPIGHDPNCDSLNAIRQSENGLNDTCKCSH